MSIKYRSMLSILKFAASGFPSDVKTQSEKEEYCRRINQKLGFDLHPDEIVYSSSLRTVSKFMNNSCWGLVIDNINA